jgi:hypothetical protein
VQNRGVELKVRERKEVKMAWQAFMPEKQNIRFTEYGIDAPNSSGKMNLIA